MIIVKLTGGIGNQLFQYTAGRSLAINKKTRLLLDISWYKGRINRSYMLDNFEIKAKIANFFQKLKIKFFNKNDYIESDKNTEWLTAKYAESIENIIREEFIPKENLKNKHKELIKNLLSENSISLHFRGTDYIHGKKSGFHGTCSPEYYNQSIKYIKDRIDSPHFFIFSDDIEWAKQHIVIPEPYTIVSNGDKEPYEEMMLMSMCKHNIIANSTFSWWGAWLNNNRQKIVITPSKWFNDEKIDTQDLIPKEWIRL